MNTSEEDKIPKIKQPPVLFSKTQASIENISQLLGGPLIVYWNNPGGSVCHNDVLVLYEILEKLGTHETIFLLVRFQG